MDTPRFDTMSDVAFDGLTRLLGATPRRRTVLGLLIGAAMGGFSALRELPDAAAGGKGKNKKKKKKKKKAPPKPQVTVPCTGNAVVCAEGVCVPEGECCPWEKPCGAGCILDTLCCPDTERQCAGGTCIAKDACCFYEETCGTDCCPLGLGCCHGVCGGASSEICTADGWCATTEGQACCAGTVQECENDPCCKFAAGEGCCVTSLDPFKTHCCPGGVGQCAPGGCCPTGTAYKSDCDACCYHGTPGCQVCTRWGPGRG
jgi:hypothetical protein